MINFIKENSILLCLCLWVEDLRELYFQNQKVLSMFQVIIKTFQENKSRIGIKKLS